MPHRVKACEEILDHMLEEFIATAKFYMKEGTFCPHKHPQHWNKVGAIMEDVKDAHDLLHIAMHRAGEAPHHPEKYAASTPAHAGMAVIPSHAAAKT